ncbi:hypothetical protein J7L81_05860 [Candidatus Aerophobetes bacterium]|nr:hypothetical protein [Candidatus Aerophobetes bacterium]
MGLKLKKRFKWTYFDTIYSIVLFSMLGVIGLWLMDIGASVGNLEHLKVFGIEIFAQSLFFKFSGSQIYHIGLFFAFVSLFYLSALAVKKSLEVQEYERWIRKK